MWKDMVSSSNDRKTMTDEEVSVMTAAVDVSVYFDSRYIYWCTTLGSPILDLAQKGTLSYPRSFPFRLHR